MTIDFHMHSEMSRRIPFSEADFNNCIAEAKSENIDCIALTEHYNVNTNKVYKYLEDNYKYESEYYLVNGIKVFIGTEVTTSMGLDIVFVGNRRDISNLRNTVINSTSENEYIEIEELFKIPNLNNMLVVLAHPFRHHDEFPKLPDFVLDKIDAIEYNATDLYKKGIDNMKEKVEGLSENINIPVIGGGDSHHFTQIGSIKTILDKEAVSIEEIKKQVYENQFKVEISNNLLLKVENARKIKKQELKNNEMGERDE